MRRFESLVRKPRTLAEAEQGRTPRVVWQVLIYIGIILAGSLVGGIVMMIPSALWGIIHHVAASDLRNQLSSPEMAWLASAEMLYATTPVLLGVMLYVRRSERRSWYSMGFGRGNVAGRYVGGYLLGILAISAAVGVEALCGAVRFEGWAGAEWWMLLLFFGGFAIQGMEEELVLRGGLMVSASTRMPVWGAVSLNSVLFALLHLLNSGITVLAVLNLVLFGVFASLFFLRTDSIWGIGAFHSAWNFFQGNIFGAEVSGGGMPQGSRLLEMEALPGSDLVHGGAFGPEGGVAVTALYLLAIALVLWWPRRRGASAEAAEAGADD